MELYHCRICNGTLRVVLDLGMMHPSGFFLDGDERLAKQPLVLAQCNDCEFVQLKHVIPQDWMYRNYWYESGMNPSMLRSLRDIVDSSLVYAPESGTILDIGANDGSMLAMYPKSYTKVGFDPALNLHSKAQGKCDYAIPDYFSAELYPGEAGPANIVTAIAMFYDLNSPAAFLEDVHKIMADDGVFIVQMADLVSMMKANAFDNICIEHAGYYTLAVVKRLFAENGFSVFKVEYNDVNGGSVRIYATKKGHLRAIDNCTYNAFTIERDYLEGFKDPFMAFSMRVMGIALSIAKTMMYYSNAGHKIYALGASTKGNTLLQYCGLNSGIIKAIGEVNIDKLGRKTAGSGIPIISEAEVLEARPDIIVILPWHFREFFIKKLWDVISDGAYLFFPLPEPELVSVASGGLFSTKVLTGETVVPWANLK